MPDGYYTTPIGKARVVQDGDDATIITYGLGVQWAEEAMKAFPNHNIGIIDLRSLAPIDWETILNAVKRTGRALLLHEDTLTGGIGAELAARIAEHCFEYLDAPVMRCASLDTPVPFAGALEQAFLANANLVKKLQSLIDY